MFLVILQNIQENTCAIVSFLINFIKKMTLAQVFFGEFCEISKKTFFTEHLRTIASVFSPNVGKYRPKNSEYEHFSHSRSFSYS